MNKTIIITKNQSLILLNEEDNDEYVEITGDEYLNYLRMVTYHGNMVHRIPRFKNKKIIITTDLDVSGLPVKTLGNIIITKGLDISGSQISTLDGVEIRSNRWINDYDTPLRKIRERKEFLAKVAEQQSKREDGEWDENSELDVIGLCANALFVHLTNHDDYVAKETGDDEKLEQYRNRIEEIESIEGYNENDELVSEVENLTEEIEEIEKKIDVYNLNYVGTYYRLHQFSILYDGAESSERYVVGDYDDTNNTAVQMAEQYIDDVGIDEMNEHFIENYIDEEEFKDYFRYSDEEYVRESLESFFDEDDFEYSKEVQERIDEIEARLEDSENLTEEEYDELNEELDELKDSEKTVSEDLIDDKVEELLDDKARDMVGYLREVGENFNRFVDTR